MTTAQPAKSSMSRGRRRRRRDGRGPDRSLAWPDRVFNWLLLVAIVLATLALGAVEMWSQQLLFGVVALMAVVAAIRPWVTHDRGVWHWAFVPMMLFVGLVVVQLMPGSEALSTGAVRLRADLLGQELAGRVTTASLVPHMTQDHLRLVLLGAVVFVCVTQVYRRWSQMVWIMNAVATLGLAVAVLSIAQTLSKSDSIYWTIFAGRGVATGGPFVHYSHFGQFMNLCLGLAISVLLVHITRIWRGEPVSVGKLIERYKQRPYLDVWLLSGFTVIGAVSVFLSGSRTASLSLIITSLLSVLALMRLKMLPGRGWVAFPLIVAVVAAGAFVGLEQLGARLGAVAEQNAVEARLTIWRDIANSWGQFPLLGTGLGTFQYVYPMHDTGTNFAVAVFAENQYVQMLTETGLVGLLLVLCFAGVLLWSAVRLVLRASSSAQVGIAGLLLALVTAMTHAMTDFALHVPANIVLMATVAGFIVVLPRLGNASSENNQAGGSGLPKPRTPWATRVLLLLPVAGGVWMLAWTIPAASAEQHERASALIADELEAQNWEGDDEHYVRALQAMQAAAALQPSNPRYLYLLSHLRWTTITRERDQTGQRVLDETGQDYARRILAELQTNRVFAPTDARPVRLLADIQSVIEPEQVGQTHGLLHRLDRVDPEATLSVLQDSARAGDLNAVQKLGMRYIELTNDRQTVAAMLIDQFNEVERASELYWDDTAALPEFETMLRARSLTAQADAVRSRYLERLDRNSRADRPEVSMLIRYAEVLAEQGDTDRAIAHYNRALALRYEDLSARFALARLLVDRDRLDEALEQVRICLRMQPEWEPAKRLLAELLLRQDPS